MNPNVRNNGDGTPLMSAAAQVPAAALWIVPTPAHVCMDNPCPARSCPPPHRTKPLPPPRKNKRAVSGANMVAQRGNTTWLLLRLLHLLHLRRASSTLCGCC